MNLKAGSFIKSTAALVASFFEQSIILIVEYNSNGAIGYVLNKHFHRRLNELVEFRTSPALPLYEGGPVDQEHLFFLHQRPDLINEGVMVNEVYHGGDFKQAIEAINSGKINASEIKIFIGYCGWDAGELEAEIGEGSWEIIEDENIFSNYT